MKSTIAFLLLALALPSVVLAQGVYVTPGANGPIYSDKPQPGAREMTLKPLNVMPAPQEPPARAASVPAASVAGRSEAGRGAETDYRAFSVLQPQDNGSMAANTALFDVRLAVDPPLRLGEGHAFVVAIDGRPVGQRFTSTEFTIPPEFFGATLPPTNQRMQLDAQIVDADGQVIRKAAPVGFFMRLVDSVDSGRRRPPRPVHKPVTKPPAPAQSVAPGARATADAEVPAAPGRATMQRPAR